MEEILNKTFMFSENGIFFLYFLSCSNGSLATGLMPARRMLSQSRSTASDVTSWNAAVDGSPVKIPAACICSAPVISGLRGLVLSNLDVSDAYLSLLFLDLLAVFVSWAAITNMRPITATSVTWPERPLVQ